MADDPNAGKGNIPIIVAIVGAIATIVVALIGHWGQDPKTESSTTPTPTPVASPASPGTRNDATEVKYPNVSGAWAEGQDPDRPVYTLEQRDDEVRSVSENTQGKGAFSTDDEFTMNWGGENHQTAHVGKDRLDWSNGLYWVRPGTKITPEPYNVSGPWAHGNDPFRARWTLYEAPDRSVTSEGESGTAQGHYLDAGVLRITWPKGRPQIGVVQRNRVYWDDGTYWVRVNQ